MNNAASPLESLFDEALKKKAEGEQLLARAQAIIKEANIEMNTLRRADKAFAQRGSDSEVNSEKAPDGRVESAPKADEKLFSKVSDKWRDIYQHLYSSASAPYSYDTIILAMEDLGHKVSKPVLRSQIQGAAKSGIFSKPQPGKYTFTREAIDAFGLTKNPAFYTTRGLRAAADSFRNGQRNDELRDEFGFGEEGPLRC